MNIQYDDFVLNNELKIHYSMIGTGPPILLIHGGFSRMQTFFSLFPLLSLTNSIYAVDVIGNGNSSWLPKSQKDYCVEVWSNQLEMFIDEVIKEPVVVLGHSLGGFIATTLASKKSPLIQGLIVIETPLMTEILHRPEFWEPLKFWTSIAKSKHSDLLDLVVSIDQSRFGGKSIFASHLPFYAVKTLNMIDPDLASLITENIGAILKGYESEDILTQITCPILLLAADPNLGSLMSQEIIEKVKNIVKHKFVFSFVLDGTRNSLHRDDPAKVSELISSFYTIIHN